MRERLVRLGHSVRILALLDRVPAAAGRIHQLVGEPLHHRLLAALPRVAHEPADGERLASACVDVARERGCERVILSSGTWMTAAHRLYERLGFVRVPERDWSPREDVHLLAYELPLTPT